MDDVIKLVRTGTPTFDEYGNAVVNETTRQVFCKVRSVGRTEYYQATQNGLFPTYVFRLSHFKDYEGEKDVLYKDWTGVEKRYSITRTYRDGNSIELTCEEKVSDYE